MENVTNTIDIIIPTMIPANAPPSNILEMEIQHGTFSLNLFIHIENF